jgi:hypothetical protein
MKYVPFLLCIIGGALLLIPAGNTDVAFSDVLGKAHIADRASKIEALKQVSRMSDPQSKAKAWTELDQKEFAKNFDEWGNTVAKAIQDGHEAELIKALEK